MFSCLRANYTFESCSVFIVSVWMRITTLELDWVLILTETALNTYETHSELNQFKVT